MATKRPGDLIPSTLTEEERFEQDFENAEDDLFLAPDGTMTTYHDGDEDDEESVWYQSPPKVMGIPVTELNGTDD